MEERNWKYKIGGNWFTVIVVAITTAVFGGVAFWCHAAGNQGGLVGFGGLTGLFAIVCIRLIYAELSFKLLVDESGFYFRTTLRDGHYYRYREIRSMWLTYDKRKDFQQATYCNFETRGGKQSKFLVLDPQLDAVDYMIERVDAVKADCEEDDSDRGFVISGKAQVKGIVIFVIFAFPMLYLILFRWNSMPLYFRMIPVAVLLVSMVQVFSHGLFYKVKIQKDGFYCRTNPFNGRYYRYRDILDCGLVEAERHNSKGISNYAHYMKFTDCANRTHRVLYDKSLYEREMNELVARIERARNAAE